MLTEVRQMIDLEDNDVIEALNRAGWVKIEEDDVVISRGVLQSLIFRTNQTGDVFIPAQEATEK
jgi:hypothetical protein